MEALLQSILDYLGGLIDFVADLFSPVIDFFNDILDWVICLVRTVLAWFVESFVDFITPMLNELYGKFPELPILFEGMSETMAYVAWWVPFDIIIPIMSSYWTFELYLIGLKLILKLIPGIK